MQLALAWVSATGRACEPDLDVLVRNEGCHRAILSKGCQLSTGTNVGTWGRRLCTLEAETQQLSMLAEQQNDQGSFGKTACVQAPPGPRTHNLSSVLGLSAALNAPSPTPREWRYIWAWVPLEEFFAYSVISFFILSKKRYCLEGGHCFLQLPCLINGILNELLLK